MRKESILIGILGMLLLVVSVRSQGIPITGTCINSSYLSVSSNITVSGSAIPISSTTIYCPYGCVANQGQYGDDCQMSPSDYASANVNAYLPIIVGITAIIFLFAFLAMKFKPLDKDMGYLQTLFLILTFLFVLFDAFFILQIATMNNVAFQEPLNALFMILLFLFALMLIMLFIVFMKMLVERLMKSTKSYSKGY